MQQYLPLPTKVITLLPLPVSRDNQFFFPLLTVLPFLGYMVNVKPQSIQHFGVGGVLLASFTQHNAFAVNFFACVSSSSLLLKTLFSFKFEFSGAQKEMKQQWVNVLIQQWKNLVFIPSKFSMKNHLILIILEFLHQIHGCK